MDSGRAAVPAVDPFGLIHAVHRAVKVGQAWDNDGSMALIARSSLTGQCRYVLFEHDRFQVVELRDDSFLKTRL